MNKIKPIGNRQFYFYVLLLILFGTSLRLFLILNSEYSIQSSYSTHAKTALNYEWIEEVLPVQSCEWYDNKELFDHFYKLDNKRFDYKNLYRELEISNHPPLYYIMAHFLQSLNKNGYPAYNLLHWMNLLFSMVAMIFFLMILSELLLNRISILIGFFWFCTSFNLSAFVLFQKAYDLQLMLSLFIVWLLIKQNKKEKLELSDFVAYSITSLMLFLTHYLSYIFVSMLGLWILIMNTIFKKQKEKVVRYAISTLVAILVALILVPFSTYDILLHGYKTIEKTNGANISKFIEIGRHIFFNITTWSILLTITTSFFLNGKKSIQKHKILTHIQNYKGFYLFVSLALICFSTLLLFSRGTNSRLRYGYIYLPYFILFAAFIMDHLKRMVSTTIVLILACQLVFSFYYLNRAQNNKILSENVVHRWHNHSLFPQETQNDAIIIVTGDGSGEHLKPYVYHSNFEKIAVLTNEFCPDMFLDLRKTTVMFDLIKPSENHKKIKEYIEGEHLHLVHETSKVKFYCLNY